MAYTTSKMDKGIHWKYSGTMTGADIMESNTAFYSLPDFDSMRFQIVDMNSVDTVDVDDSTMEIITGMDMAASKTNPYIIVAVVGPEEKIMPLVEIYENSGGGAPWKTEIFAKLIDACLWINDQYPGSIPMD